MDRRFNSIEMESNAKNVVTRESVLAAVTETGEILETEELPTEINELLSRQARMKAKIRFGRTKAKRQMKAKIALKRHSSRETLNKRCKTFSYSGIESGVIRTQR